jgi:hypothetical protein
MRKLITRITRNHWKSSGFANCITKKFTTPRPMLASADYSTIEAISKRLVEACDVLAGLVQSVASARQAREYHGDRTKKALSTAVRDVVALKPEISMSQAEHLARSSKGYEETMKKIGADLLVAEQTIAEWEVAKCRFEAARSLLSVQKTIAGQF